MPFGFLDTQFIDFPANVDVAYMQGLVNREGVPFTTVLSELDSRVGALNTGLDPLLAALLMTTTEATGDDTAPVAFIIEERSERTVARPQYNDEAAHMLPIKGYDVSLGFTEDFLMAAPLRRILNQVDSLFNGFRHLYRKQVLTRLFSDAEVAVDRKTSATSPGFAGSGTGANVFARPYPDGSALPGGYSHYYRDATANRAALIKSMRDRLARWYDPPFDLVGSAAEITAISALSDFVPAGSALVRVGTGTAEALVDPSVYVGVFDGNVRVRHALLDFTTANFAIFKSFGNLNPANALAWRYDAKRGRNAHVRSREAFPLDQAVVIQDFGIGVNNRVAATLAYVAASGAYTPPTIS